jgi:beta-1,4-mannosyl-glycoprotein beta-1,4-N-acetylglucosaminyltransferase
MHTVVNKLLHTQLMKNVKRIVKKALFLPALLDDRMREWHSKRTWLSPREIVEYRKNIKIYDIFTFFNELDVLEIRLNILSDCVDYFVIVEATETFTGHPKPLFYQENKARFKKWEHKIIHYVVDDTPIDENDLRRRILKPEMTGLEKQTIEYVLASNTVGIGVTHWFKEFYQKESIKKALVRLNDNDICYVSDVDEIWNPDLIIDYSTDDIFRPKQVAYMYYLNNRSDENWLGWTGTIVTKYKNIKDSCLNDLRTHGKTKCVVLDTGGWHFNFQGGLEGAKRKIEESNHPEYAPRRTFPGLEARILKNQDYKGRNIKFWKDERGLPKYLLENKDRYKKFFK